MWLRAAAGEASEGGCKLPCVYDVHRLCALGCSDMDVQASSYCKTSLAYVSVACFDEQLEQLWPWSFSEICQAQLIAPLTGCMGVVTRHLIAQEFQASFGSFFFSLETGSAWVRLHTLISLGPG